MSVTSDTRHFDRRVMLVGRNRVFYFGLLGCPGIRNFGSATLYASTHAPLQVSFGGQWHQRRLVWVPPYTPHRIRALERQIGVVMVEPESTDMLAVERCIRHSLGAGHEPTLLERVFRGFARLQQADAESDLPTENFDDLFLGKSLPARSLDPRIRRVLDLVCDDSAEAGSAVDLARAEGLSFSRFLHLFKSETSVPLRKYRAWRRARNLLYHVRSDASLTDIALQTGYPDSTHFSHSIRRVYGLPPREIVAGSRRLRIRVQPPWMPGSPLPAPAPGLVAASSHKSAVVATAIV